MAHAPVVDAGGGGATGGPSDEGRGADAPRPSGVSALPLAVRYGLLVVFDGLALWGLLRTVDQRSWVAFTVILVGALAVNLVYATPRLIPAKYVLPGTLFLLLFAVFPVLYTVYLSFTNYGTGHILSKSQAIERIERNSIVADPDAPAYRAEVMRAPDGRLFLFLTDPATGEQLVGEDGTLVPADPALVRTDGTRITGYGDAVALSLGERNRLTPEQREALAVETEGGLVTWPGAGGLGSASVFTQRFTYDPERDVIVEADTGTVWTPQQGRFVNPDADPPSLDPGWTVGVGFDNYRRLFTSPTLRGPFLGVFLWTLFFAVVTVAMQFALGLFLAMIFNNERMAGRGIYRTLLIIPYALPTFMTILVWRGMLNRDFGIINYLFGWSINWLGEANWARFSVLLVNMWLGFPYFFLVSTGALQGIPKDLNEAAFVDGANGFQAFRRITLPLLLIAVAPVLISSFAFNFNNFNLIQLLTNGGPPRPGGGLAGQTDILITFTTKVAFGGAGTDYGLATSISVMIFIIVAVISAVSFRLTRTFEEVR